MPISVTNPSGVQSWTSLATQFATMRTWVNAVPSADVVDASVQREHLIRPVVQGWPSNGQVSAWREHRWAEIGTLGLPMYGPKRWSIPDKYTISPDNADREGGVWITPVGAAIETPVSNVRVRFSCTVLARMSSNLYDGAHGYTVHEKVGELQVRGRNELFGLEVASDSSTVDVFCQQYTNSADNLGMMSHKVQSLAYFAAPLDRVYVVFVRTQDDCDQVDLTRVSLSVEAW